MDQIVRPFVFLGAGTLFLGACVLSTEGTAPPLGSSSSAGGSGGETISQSSTTSVGGTGGGTGAGMPMTENCLDGVDNDENGLIDCADPGCQPGFECVPAAPPDLILAHVASRSPSPNELSCSDGSSAQVVFDRPGDPLSCSGCSCAAAQDTGCSPPEVTCWQYSTSCSSNTDYVGNDGDNDCHDFPGGVYISTNDSCIRTADSAPIGACPASGGTVMQTPPPWKRQRDVCRIGQTGGGCAMGDVCAPRPPEDFEPEVCAVREGDQMCPAGWQKTEIGFSDEDDQRGCLPCQCSSPVGLSCTSGDITIYDDDNCAGDSSTVAESCVDTSSLIDYTSGSYELNSGVVSGQGSCTASGGEPTGEVVGLLPFTICCR